MKRILIQCDEVIGPKMAGAGIRYWEMAGQLAADNEVVLATPHAPAATGGGFKVIHRPSQPNTAFYEDYDVVIAPLVMPALAWAARRYHFKLIVDLYDPVLLENLEQLAAQPLPVQAAKNRRFQNELQLALQVADTFICASEKQRDLWIGALMAAGRVTPELYQADPTLRRLIEVVPFGIAAARPKKTGEGFRKRFGIKKSDTVVVWGGGIWNWFDPLTLIRAIAEITKTRSDIKLVFLFMNHPNPNIPEMEMSTQAVALAKELDVFDAQVFFNYEPIAYDDLYNHFLDGDIGASLHLDHLETRFSFRTRILYYLRASLPVITTEGDSMAELVEREQLGIVAPYKDVPAVAAAITKLADDKAFYRACGANITKLQPQLTWETATKPLLGLLEDGPQTKRVSAKELALIAGKYTTTLNDARLSRGLWPTVTGVASTVHKKIRKRIQHD